MNLSIIMPCRNHSAYLDKCIDSILNQTYKHFNCFIFNDSSTDNTQQKLEKYANLDKRIKVFKTDKSIGITQALNFLIEECDSNFIVRQDSDDFSSYDRLEKQAQFLEKNDIVSSDHYIIDYNDSIVDTIKKHNNYNVIKFLNMFYFYFGCHGNLMFKKSYYNKVKYCQDYDLISSKLINNNSCHVLNDAVYFYRKHDETIFKNHRSKQVLSSCKISQNNISQLLNIKLPLKTVLNLRYFFTYDLRFVEDKNFNFILNSLKKKYFELCSNDKNIIENEILQRLSYFKNIK